MKIKDLIGKTITEIIGKEGDNVLRFMLSDRSVAQFWHSRDCCESCYIKQIDGDLNDLIDSPILTADEETNRDSPVPEYSESFTWTFYKFSTAKGYVTISWLGESSGYYSESVDFLIIIS